MQKVRFQCRRLLLFYISLWPSLLLICCPFVIFSCNIWERLEHMFAEWFLPRFSFCSPSSFFFLPFSLVLETSGTHEFVSQTFHLIQYNRQNYLSNENSQCENSPTNLRNADPMLVVKECLVWSCVVPILIVGSFFILLGLVWKVLGFCEADRRHH